MSEDRLDQLDYYTLLGIADDASADAIQRAFHAFALKFHPDRHAGSSDDKVHRTAEIYRRGAEAYRVLLNPEMRKRYNEMLKKGVLRYEHDSTPQGEQPTGRYGALRLRSPKARPFASKALEAIRNGDWQTARLNLRLALQHEPGNPALEAQLADVEGHLNK